MLLADHVFLGAEHILLGLLSEGDGLACRALESEGLTLALAREEVLRGADSSPDSRTYFSPPFTSDAKRVLELALTEMLMLGDNKVGTEHLLLGLIRQGESAAIEVMEGCGVDPGDVRRKVIELRRLGPSISDMRDEPGPPDL